MISLVNTAPGDDSSVRLPTDFFRFGARSSTGRIDSTSLKIGIGHSSLKSSGVLPNVDYHLLTELGCQVVVEAPEHERPLTGSIGAAIVSGNLVLTKSGSGQRDLSIYEVALPATGAHSSPLAHFKFKNNSSSWTPLSPDWCNLGSMYGVYLGLELARFNTALFLFFRNNGSGGSLVFGGPQQSAGVVRPGQVEVAFPWMSEAVGADIEFWIYFNTEASSKTVEVWAKRASDAAPLLQGTLTLGSLGTFPVYGGGSYNIRNGVSDFTKIIFGNAGSSGDVITFPQWTLYPDFKRVITGNVISVGGVVKRAPEMPHQYRAKDAVLPTDRELSNWQPGSDGSVPGVSFYYQPGQFRYPLRLDVSKTVAGKASFQRIEPNLALLASGASIEGMLSASSKTTSGVTTGMGFGIEDGAQSFRVAFLKTLETSQVGLLTSELAESSFSGYTLAPASDVTSLRFYRLTVDRARSVVLLFIDDGDAPVLSLPIASFPVASLSRFLAGHVISSSATGALGIERLNYLTSYAAWEASDALTPDLAPGVPFTSFVSADPGGNATLVSELGVQTLQLTESAYNVAGSYRYYSTDLGIDDHGGAQVDVSCRINSYTNFNGQIRAARSETGCAVKIKTGTHALRMGFYDCGVLGRFVGILGNSVSTTDIIDQTSKGKSRSFSWDWSKQTTYRVVYKPFDSIQVWVGTAVGEPALVIPWDDSLFFDLPADEAMAALEFGHFEENCGSVSFWRFLRWGASTGYDVAAKIDYPAPTPSYTFGGKSMLTLALNEI